MHLEDQYVVLLVPLTFPSVDCKYTKLSFVVVINQPN